MMCLPLWQQRGRWVAMTCLASLFFLMPAVRGDEPEETSTQEAEPPAEMVATEIGIRFTPEIAKAIGGKMSDGMKTRYELDEKQQAAVQDVIAHQLMKLANNNAENGRDMIELMMAEMIRNDGRFTKEAGMEFAKLSKDLIPALQKFCTDTSGEVGKKLNMKQRLKLTTDMAAASAGLVIFENRMKRWEEGKLGDFANPFFDPADNNPELATSQPVDPKEKPEVRQARQRVERSLDWEIGVDRDWETYVNEAIEFYKFDESQSASARSILKECQQRATKIKTPQWRQSLKENRIARQLSWRMDSRLANGPWMYQSEQTFKQLLQPLNDIGDELKKRIEGLPTSQQRAVAQDEVRRKFEENGMKLTS